LPNRGEGVLLIDHVKSSCGCTVAVVSAHEIPIAADGRVTVAVDTARMAGRVNKIVTVYTNDPDNPVVGLTMTGEVSADLLVTPSPLYLGRVRRGDRTRHEVLVAPGQRVVVELDPHIPLGRFSEQVKLRTTSPHESLLTLQVFGSVEGEVVVL